MRGTFPFFAQSLLLQVEFIAVIKAQLPLTWPGLCLHQDRDRVRWWCRVARGVAAAAAVRAR